MSIAVVRGRAQRARKTILAVAITLVIATVPYWEVLAGRRTAMYGDVNDLHVPLYTAAWRTIRAGRLAVVDAERLRRPFDGRRRAVRGVLSVQRDLRLARSA